jgi:hypothetical protein
MEVIAGKQLRRPAADSFLKRSRSGLRRLRRGMFALAAARALCEVPRHSGMLHSVSMKFNPRSPAGDIKLWQRHANCASAVSSDMLLDLAGVNEHAVLRIVGSKQWSVAHFLGDNSGPFRIRSSLLSNLMLLCEP